MNHFFNKMAEISSHDVIEIGGQTILQMNLCVRFVRSATWILLKARRRMDSFIELTKKLMGADDESLKLVGTRLVKAFVEGRQCIDQEDKKSLALEVSLPPHIYVQLQSLLNEGKTSVRCSVLSTFGSLHFCEWRTLLISDAATNLNPFSRILQMALEYSGDAGSRVRSEACRAIGNIMTDCMRESRTLDVDAPLKGTIIQIVDAAVQVTTSAAEDSDASSVRSMVSKLLHHASFSS